MGSRAARKDPWCLPVLLGCPGSAALIPEPAFAAISFPPPKPPRAFKPAPSSTLAPTCSPQVAAFEEEPGPVTKVMARMAILDGASHKRVEVGGARHQHNTQLLYSDVPDPRGLI